MEFTNEEMSHCVEVMTGIKETGKLGYAIARNMRKMKDECMDYINVKNDLLQKYGQVTGSRAVVTGDNVKKFQEEIGDLPTMTADVDIFKIPEDVFLSGNLDSTQMEALLWMVE